MNFKKIVEQIVKREKYFQKMDCTSICKSVI